LAQAAAGVGATIVANVLAMRVRLKNAIANFFTGDLLVVCIVGASRQRSKRRD
jgi:hypothetical protein